MVDTQILLFEENHWTYLSPSCTTAHSVKTLRHFLHELLLCITNIVILAYDNIVILAYDKTKFHCVKFDQNRCHQTLLVGWWKFCYVVADRRNMPVNIFWTSILWIVALCLTNERPEFLISSIRPSVTTRMIQYTFSCMHRVSLNVVWEHKNSSFWRFKWHIPSLQQMIYGIHLH